MSLAADLLDAAAHLATRQRKKPRQADLRRAVSSAYYALFHTLVEGAAGVLVGARNARRRERDALGRAFQHATMRRACESFSRARIAAGPWGGPHAPLSVPPELQRLAKSFLTLQEARHRADYDAAARLSRAQALTLVGRARNAAQAWTVVRVDPVATRFVLSLLLHDRLRTS